MFYSALFATIVVIRIFTGSVLAFPLANNNTFGDIIQINPISPDFHPDSVIKRPVTTARVDLYNPTSENDNDQEDFYQQIDRIVDDQVRQANEAAVKLHGIFRASDPRRNVSLTPQQAINRIADSYAKSLRDTWDTEERDIETYFLSDLMEVMRMLFGLDYAEAPISQSSTPCLHPKGISAKAIELRETLGETEEQIDKLESLREAYRVELQEWMKLLSMDDAEISNIDSTQKPVEIDRAHVGNRVKISKNTTIDELLIKLGENCMSVMLCHAGADPESMGSFGPWALQNFNGRRWRFFYPDLAAAYFEGQNRMLYRDHERYCAKRFPSCSLTHTVHS